MQVRSVHAAGVIAVQGHRSGGAASAEFCELPKTVSGKIRRTELRATEAARRQSGQRALHEFFEADFPELLDRTRT